MHFSATTVAVALLGLAVKSVVATPPACLLAAINQQPNAADLDSLCGSKSGEVQAAMAKVCGKDIEAALKAYDATCKTAGKTVSMTSSASSTSSSSSSDSSTGSGSATGVRTSSAPYPTGSGYSPSGFSPSVPLGTGTSYNWPTVTPTMTTQAAGGAVSPTAGSAASGSGNPASGPAASGSGTSPAAPAFTGGAVARSFTGSFIGVAVVAAGFVIAL